MVDFHFGIGFKANVHTKNVMIPKGTLMRVELLSQYYYMNFSILKKYNKPNKEILENYNVGIGKYSQTLFKLSGMKYRKITNIDAYLLKKSRITKIDNLLK